jgi:hypothetical protein
MDLQRLRERRRVDQALGEEEKRKAGIDLRRFSRDGLGKRIWVGLIRGERRKARCIAGARTGQLPSSAFPPTLFCACLFLCVPGTLRVEGIFAFNPGFGNGAGCCAAHSFCHDRKYNGTGAGRAVLAVVRCTNNALPDHKRGIRQ